MAREGPCGCLSKGHQGVKRTVSQGCQLSRQRQWVWGGPPWSQSFWGGVCTRGKLQSQKAEGFGVLNKWGVQAGWSEDFWSCSLISPLTAMVFSDTGQRNPGFPPYSPSHGLSQSHLLLFIDAPAPSQTPLLMFISADGTLLQSASTAPYLSSLWRRKWEKRRDLFVQKIDIEWLLCARPPLCWGTRVSKIIM